jgi:hypothetical protein
MGVKLGVAWFLGVRREGRRVGGVEVEEKA